MRSEVAKIREVREQLRAAKRKDAPPGEIRKLEDKKEDAEQSLSRGGQTSGFEPERMLADDRYSSPSAYLEGLRQYVAELRSRAEGLTGWHEASEPQRKKVAA